MANYRFIDYHYRTVVFYTDITNYQQVMESIFQHKTNHTNYLGAQHCPRHQEKVDEQCA